MIDKFSGFNPADRKRDPDIFGVTDFEISPEAVLLSPDEAWVIKRQLNALEDDSPYVGLREHIAQHFVGGAYETAPRILVPRDHDISLAGVYTGILWQIKDTDPEGAQIVREKIEALCADKDENMQQFFRQQMIMPAEDIPKN